MFKRPLLLALEIASHLAYMIIVPLLLLGGLGLLLDRRFGTLPLYLLAGVVIALIITLFWIKKRLLNIIKASSKK